jgi:hypothetical protein
MVQFHNNLEPLVWDMVNTMVQRQQKSESIVERYVEMACESIRMRCGSRLVASRHLGDWSPLMGIRFEPEEFWTYICACLFS